MPEPSNPSGVDENSVAHRVDDCIGVLIAVGVCLYREGLAALLARQIGIEVKGLASDQDSAVAKAHALSPEIVLLDTGLTNSLATVQPLLVVAPKARVIALAVVETETEVISYAEAGVSGYVTRDGSFEDLVATIRSVARGELLCSPRISAVLLRRVARAAVGVGSEFVRLTPRELQIVELIDQGLSNKEISRLLCIEISTAKNHVHHILVKLGALGRGQAAARMRPLFLSRLALRDQP